MKKIVIIGAGFAGLACAASLRPKIRKLNLEVCVISDKDEFSFLPLLPDCLGRRIATGSLIYNIRSFSKKLRFKFINDKVERIDLDKKLIFTNGLNYSYDFLVVASGSETNFYGNDQIRRFAFKLDDAKDAALMYNALEEKDYDSYLVAGGGYTGVEIATNLSVYLKRKKLDRRVVIIERAPQILGQIPGWMRDYVLTNLKELRVEVLTGVSVNTAESAKVGLSNQLVFDNSMLIWAAGVKTSDFIQSLSLEKNPQGRIKVDKCLRFRDNCFAAGDASLFDFKSSPLRMAVQFAIMQGRCIGRNIVNNIERKELIEYKPVDFGFIIPMANNKSCGVVLGFNMKGFLPTLMHYFMCIFRSYDFKNKFWIVKNLLQKGG